MSRWFRGKNEWCRVRLYLAWQHPEYNAIASWLATHAGVQGVEGDWYSESWRARNKAGNNYDYYFRNTSIALLFKLTWGGI